MEIRQLSRREGRRETIPILSEQALLTDRSSGAFYTFGGYLSRGDSADNSTLWRYTPDGEGGGLWSEYGPADHEMFLSLNRTHSAATASSADTGFIFGGKMVNQNSQFTEMNAKGFLTFDFRSNEWAESTDTPYSKDGSLFGAEAVYVEEYGTQGLILILGGMTRHGASTPGFLDMDKIWFYDIGSRKWHLQKATGEVPTFRRRHCAVGVAGNETYEM